MYIGGERQKSCNTVILSGLRAESFLVENMYEGERKYVLEKVISTIQQPIVGK